MAGRHALPAEILKNEGRSHKTKAELEEREACELLLRIGDTALNCPSFVKSDPAAYRKWREVVALYKDVSFVSSGDRGMLARYCKAYSEYLDLTERRKMMDDIVFDDDEEELVLDDLEERRGKRWAIKTWNKINYILSTGGILSVDKAINAKSDLLQKMEDRLFLNPLSRIKAVPKKQDEPEIDPLEEAGFSNV